MARSWPSPTTGSPSSRTLRRSSGGLGLGQIADDIVKHFNKGRGLSSLLAKIPGMSRPVLSAGARLGLFMQAQLAHPQLGKAAASLFGNSKMAGLFNASRVGALAKGFGRALGPLAVGIGGYDLVTGIREGDVSQAISGGMGIAAVAAPLLIASGPVGWAVGAGLAVGSFVVSQWGDDIADGAKAAADWTGDRLSDLGDSAENLMDDAGSVLSSGAKKLGGLFS